MFFRCLWGFVEFMVRVSVVVRARVDWRYISCCIEMMGFNDHNWHFPWSAEHLMNGRVRLLLVVLRLL